MIEEEVKEVRVSPKNCEGAKASNMPVDAA